MLCEPHAEPQLTRNRSKSWNYVSTCFSFSHPLVEASQLALTKRSEEPSVLARGVTLLQCLLDSLLGILTLGNLLEGIGGNNTLQSLQLECVACWHQVVVVDDLDERLDLGALGLAGLGHAAGDLGWVTLNTSDQGVRIWVRLVAGILWLDDHNLMDPY